MSENNEQLPRYDAVAGESAAFVEAVGRLAVVASRLEHQTSVIYSQSLVRLDSGTRYVLMENVQMSTMLNHLSKILSTPVYAKSDATLSADWKRFKTATTSFIQFRNMLLHNGLATYLDGDSSQRLSISLRSSLLQRDMRTRVDLSPYLVTTDSVHEQVVTAKGLAADADGLWKRVRKIAASDTYYAATPLGRTDEVRDDGTGRAFL